MASSRNRASLEGPTVLLRILQRKEIPVITPWLQDREARFFLNPEKPIRLDAGLAATFKKVRKILKASRHERRDKFKDPIDFPLSVIRKDDNQVVGIVIFTISFVHWVGTVRTLIAPRYRRNHFAKEAKEILLKYAFLYLELVKMCSDLLEIQQATLTINEALHFRIEGKRVNHVEISDIRLNLIEMAILRDEWLRMHYPHLL